MLDPTVKSFPPLRLLVPSLAFIGGAAQAQSLPFGFGLPAPTQVAPDTPELCTPPTDPLEKAVWDVVQRDQQARDRLARTPPTPDLSCGNRFDGLLELPLVPGREDDAFSQLMTSVREARAEVLVANMFIETGTGAPGWLLAGALRDLYRKVQADPAAYPEGMTVRIATGGMPGFLNPSELLPARFAGALRSLGVPLSDPKLGWSVEVADYRYFPHSHVKMHVIDGKQVVTGGYNISAWYLPRTQPGGHDLHDLGLALSGPVARAGVAAFDDLWTKSRLLSCPPLVTPQNIGRECRFRWLPTTLPSHPPSTLRVTPLGDSRAWMLYRRAGYVQADEVGLALLRGSRQTLDLMHADFSANINCLYAFKTPHDCDPATFPSYFQEVIRAAERGVKIRVLTVDYDVGQLWNRSGIALMRQELRRRGLEHLFEARYTRFKMHTKATLVDGQMLVVGSINYHFSSWGTAGLNEAALATNDPQAIARQRELFERAWNDPKLSRPAPAEPWLSDLQPDLVARPTSP